MGEGVVQIYGVTAQFRIEKIMGKLLKLPCILCLIQVKVAIREKVRIRNLRENFSFMQNLLQQMLFTVYVREKRKSTRKISNI